MVIRAKRGERNKVGTGRPCLFISKAKKGKWANRLPASLHSRACLSSFCSLLFSWTTGVGMFRAVVISFSFSLVIIIILLHSIFTLLCLSFMFIPCSITLSFVCSIAFIIYFILGLSCVLTPSLCIAQYEYEPFFVCYLSFPMGQVLFILLLLSVSSSSSSHPRSPA